MDRPPSVAGTWYPAASSALLAAVERHLSAAERDGALPRPEGQRLLGLIAPHAGLAYSGPVAAFAYRLLREHDFDVIVLIGPSHYVPFEGVSLWPRGKWQTPLGDLQVDERLAQRLMKSCPLVTELPAAHQREHSLEMQLPFLASLALDTPILPMVIGHQTRATAFQLGSSLAEILEGQQALLVASSDLSHFYDGLTAADLDAVVIDRIQTFDPEGLMTTLEDRPDHACGGGAIVSVLAGARAMGATRAEVLRYADSGDVSGDKSSVVGYLAAAVWG
jgi:AmmeMemoRadiSam system protein B